MLYSIVANAQVVQNIAIKPSSERGYLEVTVLETTGVTNTGPVCGAADVGTAFVACQMSEWLTTIQYGTTSQLGLVIRLAYLVSINSLCISGA